LELDIGLSTTGFSRGEGCRAWKNTGDERMVGLYEFMELDDETRPLVVVKAPGICPKTAAVKSGFRTCTMKVENIGERHVVI
jgi:type II secretory ATPase GspE/PulE/Tfp pilus assembly ATPase PilB-like protein